MRATILGNTVALLLLVGGCNEDEVDLTPDDGSPEVADADGGVDDVSAPDEGSDSGTEDVVVPDEGTGEDDGGARPSASMTDETWYEGSVSCATPSIAAVSPSMGVVVVTLLQIPADEIQGSCTGHWVANESEMIAGPDILIILDGPMGSTCWTACWDFEITIRGVPPGSYTVSLVGMSLSAAVEVLWPPD